MMWHHDGLPCTAVEQWKSMDFAHESTHFYCGFSGFRAFISIDSASAVDGLLFVIDSDDAENHRDAGCGIQIGHSLRHAIAYTREMRSFATDNTAQNYDYIAITSFNKL